MDKIIQSIQKVDTRSNAAVIDALKRALDSAYVIDDRDRNADLDKQKNEALSKWFADAAEQLPTLVAEMAISLDDEEVKRDWRAIFGDQDFNDYFYAALELTTAKHKPELSLIANVTVRLEFGEDIPCVGDNCWYAGNRDRLSGITFYKNLISNHIFCDMCIHKMDHADIPAAEVADDFIAFCKERRMHK